MSKTQEQINPSLGDSEKPESGGSQLLDRPFILGRCLLEPGGVVLALMYQELGS